jgi:hypothetical protein
VDGRDKPGHDEKGVIFRRSHAQRGVSKDEDKDEFVARMERSEIRGSVLAFSRIALRFIQATGAASASRK